MRRFLAIAAALIAAVAAWPSAQAWLAQGTAAAPSGSVTVFQAVVPSTGSARYLPLGMGAMAYATDVPGLSVPISGTFSNLNVHSATSISSGSITLTIEHNGSSAMSCTLNSSTQTCSPSSPTSFSVSPGDYVGVNISALSGYYISYSVDFTSSVAGESIIHTFTNAWPTSGKNYLPFGSEFNSPASSAATYGVLNEGGTLSHYYVTAADPSNAGSSFTYGAITQSGTDLGYSIALSAGCASPTWCSGNNTSTTATVTPGNYYNFWASAAGSPTAGTGLADTAMEYQPTTSGHFMLMGGVNQAMTAATAINYWSTTGSQPITTEADAQIYSNAETITEIDVYLNGAPSTGTLTMTLNDNGASSGASCALTASPALTHCSMSGLPYTIAAGHLVDIEGNPGSGIGNTPRVNIISIAHR